MGEPARIIGEAPASRYGSAEQASKEVLTGNYRRFAQVIVADEFLYPYQVVSLTKPYDPRIHENPVIPDTVAGAAGELAAGHEAEVISLPLEDATGAKRPPTQPGTTISFDKLRDIFSNKKSFVNDRVLTMLTYAMNCHSQTGESLYPEYLKPFMPDNPADWALSKTDRFSTNIERLNHYLTQNKSKKRTNKDRYVISDILEDTQQFDNTPLLRNFAFMNYHKLGNPEVEQAEMLTRMMLSDALADAEAAGQRG